MEFLFQRKAVYRMRLLLRAQSTLTKFFLFVTFAALSVPVFAQASTPPPPGHTLADNIAALSVRAAQTLPKLQAEFVSVMLSWAETIAIGLASVILLYSFARLWRESGGVGLDALWWLIRLGVCLFLLNSGPYLVDQLYLIGQEIAEGNEIQGAGGQGLPFEFYDAQRYSFNESYKKFSEGHFTVTVEGETLELEGAPTNSSTGGVLGVIYDSEATVKDIDRKLDVTSYSMPTLFSIFNATRGIVDTGDFWLIIAGALLMIAAKLLAPFAMAAAIDSKLAHKFTYPYAWGVIVLTLAWPAVSYTLRGLAYMFGNLAMAVGDSEPQYRWFATTMTAIKDPSQHPAYTVVIAAFGMIIIGACVWVSPFITAYLVQGKFYEGVSQITSGFAGAIIGTGVETYSQSAASAVSVQASKVQADAGYAADVARSSGEFQGANLATRARQTMAVSGVQGNRVAQLGGIEGSRINQVKSAQAGLIFGVNSVGATAALSKAETQVRTSQSISDIRVDTQKQTSNIENSRATDTQKWLGDKAIMGSAYAADSLRSLSKSKEGQTPLAARGVAGAVEMAGGAYGLREQYKSIQNRAGGQQAALDQASQGQISNREQAAQGHNSNQDTYLNKMTTYHKEFAAGQTDAANAAAAQAAGGVNRGASIQIGGINRGTALEMRGNQVRFDAQKAAADKARDGAIEAAKLHALSTVMNRIGSKLAQEIEQGMSKLGSH